MLVILDVTSATDVVIVLLYLFLIAKGSVHMGGGGVTACNTADLKPVGSQGPTRSCIIVGGD